MSTIKSNNLTSNSTGGIIYTANTASSTQSLLNAAPSLYNQYTSAYSDTTYGGWFTSSGSLFDLIVLYLTEDKIREILDEIKSKNVPEDMFQNAVIEIISDRHVSEEFILNYLDIDASKIDNLRRILYKQHKADILSGNYTQLALLLEITKEN